MESANAEQTGKMPILIGCSAGCIDNFINFVVLMLIFSLHVTNVLKSTLSHLRQ